jgi:hypothetical protein
MPVTDIKELRILPPLAIARFGSSPEPLDNYDVKVNEQDVAGFRVLEPAETLVVDRATGEITGVTTPDAVRFKDAAGNIKPTAPFFELWARFDANDFLEPLTQQHLADLHLTPASVMWRVRVGNLKLFRRTGAMGDKIEADTGQFADHAVKQLTGDSEHFKDGKTVPLGSVQYLRPNDAFPEIRLRFTPAAGKVYGHLSGDPNIVDDVYDPNKGRWDDHNDGGMNPPGTPPSTIPVRIYAVVREGPDRGRNLGYLDDSCDGIIEAQLAVGAQTFSAFARVTVGPPHFAPDSFHPRTVAHEIEQILFGPEVTDTVDAERATELIRRAVETVRLTNTDFWNVAYGDGTFDPPVANYAHARTRHEVVLADLSNGLKAAPGSVERQRAVGALTLIHSMLRRQEQVVDLSREVAQLMPALMRGSNGLDVAVTRRELNLIEKAARDFGQLPPAPQLPTNTFEQDMVRIIGDLSIHANRHMKFVLANGQRLSDLFADPPALLNFLRTEKARGLGAGPLLGKPLVVPGDPDASAFVGILETPGHPMRAAFQAIDPTTGRKRVEIVREWIRALTP